MENFPHLLVLDFDGVLCNGLREYFQSSKQVCQQIWSDQEGDELEKQRENFYHLRPVIETGWEMPLLLRALTIGIDPAIIAEDWSNISQTLQAQNNIGKAQLAPALDQVRDDYINGNLDYWLGLHQFYPGVIQQLHHWLNDVSGPLLYIVTTKEGRFVRQLLQAQGLNFPLEQIIGKEIKQPKFKTLQQLLDKHNYAPAQLWFVEDMLTTLQSVAGQPQLAETGLFLADWGYNTESTRESAKNQNRFHLLDLQRFCQDFAQWNKD